MVVQHIRKLPFTPDEFFAVFAEYNRAFWPVAIALWLTTASILALVWPNRFVFNQAERRAFRHAWTPLALVTPGWRM